MKAGLLTSTYLDAMGVQQLKQSYQDHAMDEELQARMYVSRVWEPPKAQLGCLLRPDMSQAMAVNHLMPMQSYC